MLAVPYNIEISVMCHFDLAHETEWALFNSFIASETNIKYIGFDGEHIRYAGRGLKNMTETELIGLFDRGRIMVESVGKSFVCYYSNFGMEKFRERYMKIFHSNYPTSGYEYILDWSVSSSNIGISCGTYSKTIPSPWNYTDVSKVIDHALAKSNSIRYCINFAIVEALWTPEVKNMIWTKMQTCPERTFILATDTT